MTNQTLPGFSGKIRGAMSETKHQSRIRNDVNASSRYAKRLEIDHRMEERRLQRELKEILI